MQKNNFQIQHILVNHDYEAKDILLKLKSADQFSEFAKKYSKCASASAGGNLGPFKSGRFVEAFEDACELLVVNQISKPVRTQFGWHIILKT
jgi:peptidyl-prolyl cis-trans isomerase C